MASSLALMRAALKCSARKAESRASTSEGTRGVTEAVGAPRSSSGGSSCVRVENMLPSVLMGGERARGNEGMSWNLRAESVETDRNRRNTSI